MARHPEFIALFQHANERFYGIGMLESCKSQGSTNAYIVRIANSMNMTMRKYTRYRRIFPNAGDVVRFLNPLHSHYPPQKTLR